MATLIAGLGAAAPEHSIRQTDAAEYVQGMCVATPQRRVFARSLYSHSGVEKRHSVLLESTNNGEAARQSFFSPPDDSARLGPTTGDRMDAYRAAAGPLADRAARAALRDASLAGADVTHLVLVSCSGFAAPGVDVALISSLGLPPTVSRTSVGFMGCHGALNGLRVGDAYCRADPRAVVLVVAVELCTIHYQYDWTPERIIANSLFADGAAAAVLRAGEPGGAAGPPTIAASYSEVLPDSLDAMTWRIGDNGFDMTLSREVPGLIERETGDRVRRWLADAGLAAGDIAAWAIHPGGPRILSACEAALGLPDDALVASRAVLADYGNMSSPTVLFVLERLRRAGPLTPCVMLGFGPGLAIEALLLR
ncbi:type III polyketide synthase [Botrimarina sp.]|uniref:type III polyketide synthase n=1 Tax=Botrimarina sp. TaxID=2795802 RepID=UPI0032ED2225